MTKTAVLLLAGPVLLVASACGDGDSESRVSDVPNGSASPARPPAGESEYRSLDRDAACDEFYELLGQFTLSDEESAVAYYQLASRTADRQLADAIGRIGDGFARSDTEIYSTEVAALCE